MKKKSAENKSSVQLRPAAHAETVAYADAPEHPVIHNSPVMQRQEAQVQRIRGNVMQREEAKNNTGMPDNLKSGIENLSGMSMDDVKVHYNSPRPAQLNALAYAQGTDIHVASGQEKHLPHEAWHIVQQKQGRVKPTLQMKTGTPVNDDPGLETEADVMGAKALQMQTAAAAPAPAGIGGTRRDKIVQREEDPAAADLRKIIAELHKGVAAAQETEGVAILKEQISGLQEVLDSGDKDIIAETVNDLNTELGEETGELGSLGSKQESTGSENGVVQGVFGGYLLYLAASWLFANPVKALVLAAVVERVVARAKRKNLPRRVGSHVFHNDRMTYYFLVKRKINLFRRAHNLTDHDEEMLEEKARAALTNVHGENDYLYNRLPEELGQGLNQYDNPNMGVLLGPNAINLAQSIFTDIGDAINKNLNHPVLTTTGKGNFTKALKKMPFVKKLYSGKIHADARLGKNSFNKKKLSTTTWKNGGSLPGSIEEVDDGYSYITRDRRQVDDGTFRSKVRQAEHFIKLSVEPEVLALVPRPVIKVHLRNQKSRTNPFGFRAYQQNGEIHVAQDEDQSVIVHELGHYIEYNLPVSKWMDIQLLLHSRNNNQQKGQYIYRNSYSEQRFGGEYPATGPYTSKYYETGSTEVMSMSMEYLAHPQNFKDLIEKDPQQAAIILRLIRPTEYGATGSLRNYDQYLPH